MDWPSTIEHEDLKRPIPPYSRAYDQTSSLLLQARSVLPTQSERMSTTTARASATTMARDMTTLSDTQSDTGTTHMSTRCCCNMNEDKSDDSSPNEPSSIDDHADDSNLAVLQAVTSKVNNDRDEDFNTTIEEDIANGAGPKPVHTAHRQQKHPESQKKDAVKDLDARLDYISRLIVDSGAFLLSEVKRALHSLVRFIAYMFGPTFAILVSVVERIAPWILALTILIVLVSLSHPSRDSWTQSSWPQNTQPGLCWRVGTALLCDLVDGTPQLRRFLRKIPHGKGASCQERAAK